MLNKLKPYTSWIIFFILGVGVGIILPTKFNFNRSDIKQFRVASEKYNFIRPLLLCEIGDKEDFPEYNSLTRNTEEYIRKAERAEEVNSISLYFRDLSTGKWTGVNDEKLYDPASLMKLILLVAYLRSAEQDPSILTKKLQFKKSSDKYETYQSPNKFIDGKYYSVEELLVDMIVKSGNDSTNALFNNINKAELEKIYLDLGFAFPKKDAPELISPRTYSRLFRVLFSSTYLPRSISEQVLNLLSKSEFNKGLTAELPKGMIVAHKFGERTFNKGNDEIHQLHDCGIVYDPNNPYFLCVMTEGKDFSVLEKTISDLSKIVYSEVSN